MSEPDQDGAKKQRADFLAGGEGGDGFARQVLGFLRASGKWWLAPVIVVLMLLGLALMMGGTAVGPFIYAAF